MGNEKIRKSVLVLLVVSIVVVGFVEGVVATDHYTATNGSDTTGDGSLSNPWQTLQHSIAQIAGGDTLIIRDGIYAGASNILDHDHRPISGSEQSYTTIKAEHKGEVVFDGEGVRVPVDIDNVAYIAFEGVVFRNSSGSVFDITNSDHIKILGCGMGEAFNNESIRGSSLFFRYVDYALIEDTYIWGSFRYGFFMLDSSHLILRRCVARQDRGIAAGYSNMGPFRIYSSSNVSLQNCIAIDGDQTDYYLQNSDSGLVPATPKSYWPGGNNGPTHNVHILGSMALNNRGMSMYILSYQHAPQNNTVKDSVFWGGKNGLWSRVEEDESVLFEHLTVGEIETGRDYNGIRGEYGHSIVARNNIIYGCGSDSGDYALVWTDNPSNSSDYNVLYNNTNNYRENRGAHPGLNDICEENGNAIDPLTGLPGNGLASLKYFPRIEDGSDLDGVASDGEDIGATILYKLGRDGTLWGEEGFNETTNESLWPFPNEDLIKEQMSQYYYDDPADELDPLRGDRGFCAEGTGIYGGNITLTSYIWEYLGNPCPPEICDYAPAYHQADLNDDGIINMPELMAFIARWKISDGVSKSEVEEARDIWFSGGVY
ncbi:MAG: right-handed parallel beta-helix repeat-containing protein [Candidatus Altiarchaeota archaeon]|nr:right-handed parallel beta-helix repeat-containing protein [Candidatus Altiarchaeota archaeon]